MRRVIPLVAIMAWACSSVPQTTSSTVSAVTSAPAREQTTTSAPPSTSEGEVVIFPSDDSLNLEGRLFGSGQVFVVLAHMRGDTMESWFSFARELAAGGYSALAFNFRGVAGSEGEGFAIDTDVIGAIDYALSRGAERVFLIGASMGGTAAIGAAARRPVAGVVTLSAPATFQGVDAVASAALITAPMVLIAGSDDEPYNEDARLIAEAAGGAADLRIVPSSVHGTSLLADMGQPLHDLILNFIGA